MSRLNRYHCRVLMLSAALLAGTVEARAEASPATWQTDEVVVTATRTPNPVSKLPMAVEVITRQQIEESGAMNLSDVLEEAQGVNALEPTNGRLGVASLRGLDSRLTLVLVDGIRLTQGFQGYSDLREIPAGIIDRVEIVRGAGSALYGSDAVGGVINVITRQPTRDLQGGLAASGGMSRLGQAGTVATDGWLSGTTGRLGYSVAGSYYDRDRYDRDHSDLMTDGDDRVIGSGSVALTYALKPGVKLSGGFIYADNQLDGIRTQTSGDFDRSVNSDRLIGYFGAEISTGSESSLTLRASRTTYDWSSDMDNVNALPYVTATVASGIRTTTETTTTTRTKVSQDADQFEARWTGKLNGAHLLTLGAEYRTEDREDESLTLTRKVVTRTNATTGVRTSGPTTTTTTDASSISHDVHNLGLFAQDEIRVLEPLSVIAGIRYDDHSDFGSRFSPKIAALLRIDDHLKLRASYGEGFRAPSLYELYTGSLQTRKSIILANADLEAETSKTYELGADLSLGRFTAGVTAFRNEVKNLISQVLVTTVTTPWTYRFDNLSEAMSRGIEFNASVRLPYGFRLSDQVTFLDTEDESTGDNLLFAPDVTNIVRLDYVNSRLGLKGNIRVVTTGTQSISPTDKSSGYSLVNCFLSKEVSKGTELYAGVDNLFNDDTSAAYGNNEGAGLMGTYYYCGVNYKF
ncbi:MAG: TonB-dependent receptor [Chlorobiaceae bacterium]|nr:TonB-dependent receptor [Chlorobiaceae bacterium]